MVSVKYAGSVLYGRKKIVKKALHITLLGGFGIYLNGGTSIGMWIGAAIVLVMLFGWFGTVINESLAGKYNDQVDMSFRWGMGWFIFSEVMFFAAFLARCSMPACGRSPGWAVPATAS